jgi:hypothetical protein
MKMDWLIIVTLCIASLGLVVAIWSIIDTRKKSLVLPNKYPKPSIPNK